MKTFFSYLHLLLGLWLFTGYTANGQDTVTTRFLDSLHTAAKQVIQSKDSTTAIADSLVTDEVAADTTVEELPMDTAIVSHERVVNKDTLALLKKDKGFYYQSWLDSLLRAEQARLRNEKPPPKLNLPDFTGLFTALKIILWLLAVSILVLVIYKLFLGKNALFISNRKNIETVVTADDPPTAAKYEALFLKAETEQDYRMAVRYRYLHGLFLLSEKGLVVLGTEKTNYQYVNEVRKHAAKAADLFSSLTLKYDYVWYGEYPVRADMYTLLQKDFNDFYQQIT